MFKNDLNFILQLHRQKIPDGDDFGKDIRLRSFMEQTISA
jgi:hypothetical protein